jgi:hypothetical protein
LDCIFSLSGSAVWRLGQSYCLAGTNEFGAHHQQFMHKYNP